MSTNLDDSAVKNKYVDLHNQLDFAEIGAKAFLPFLTEYNFLDAYYSLRELLDFYICIEGVKKKEDEVFNTIYSVRDCCMQIHFNLMKWEQTRYNSNAKDKVKSLFNDSNCNPLLVCKCIDAIIKAPASNEELPSNRDYLVLNALKLVFLRGHCMENDIDLSAYLGGKQ